MNQHESSESLLKRELAYLSTVKGVRWVDFERDCVYIGFDPLPDDWRMIIEAAALHGDRAMRYGCRVWGMDANNATRRPTDGAFYGKATSRHARLEFEPGEPPPPAREKGEQETGEQES